jgi:tyrosinase
MADSLFVRRDVWKLSRQNEWHPVIKWYARGIGRLQEIDDLSDPRSWIGMANIHGTLMPRSQWPSGIGNREWNACQHGSWFFLPWHRMYLHHFEKIVRWAVVDLGGPQDWALPYWNYNPADPDTLAIPPAFRQPNLDGDPNPLFVQRRRPSINAGQRMPAEDVETTGWRDRFTAKSPAVPTFGGPKTGWTHNGPGVGQLEMEPHGLVHVEVGGTAQPPGLMSLFETAGQDPIFWLHHANIDRLWQVWDDQPGHRNPKDKDWSNAEYEFGSGNWKTKLRVGKVVDTKADPLRYRYEDVGATPAPAPGPDGPGGDERVAVTASTSQPEEETMPDEPVDGDVSAEEEEVPPELVGATDAPVPLSDDVTTIGVSVGEPAGPSAEATRRRGGRRRRTYLTLENVTGSTLGAGKYVVYVNLPEGAGQDERKAHRAGRISTFGVVEESRSDDEHAGSGTTFSFDITGIVKRLEESGEWDAANVRVTIEPRRRREGDAPPAGDVQVGRVGVYVE